MSYKMKQLSPSVVENELKYIKYQDKIANWVLSKYRDETQLLPPQELQFILPLVEEKVLNHNENLFLIASILKIFRKQLNINEEQEQHLAIVTINFVEKAQQEQIEKISNPHAIAGKVLLWTQGEAVTANTVFRTILQSKTFVNSNYLENLALWLASKQQESNYLLTGEALELALKNACPSLTEIENKFLVRSLVYSLRS